MRFFSLGFFHESVSPGPMSIPLGPFQIFSKIPGYIREWMFITVYSCSMGPPLFRLPIPQPPKVGSSSPGRRGWMSRRSPNPEWRGVWDPLSPPPGPGLQTLDPVLKFSKFQETQNRAIYQIRQAKVKELFQLIMCGEKRKFNPYSPSRF